jgi:tetratricopeptide (TPR) repeat protein
VASLQLEVRVSKSPELAAHGVLQSIRAAESGDSQRAVRGYRDALAMRFVHPDSWSNLAALAIALEDPQTARQHAMRALQLDQRHADAWVNLGVASWHAGQRREGAQAMSQALQHVPGLAPAALNYALMLRVVDRLPQAHEVLAGAVQANPGEWRVHHALAETARLLERHDVARRHVLAALGLIPASAGNTSPAPVVRRSEHHGQLVAQTLVATADAFDGAGLPFHLIGGTLLALYRDGTPFPHDKDIDLGMPFDVDRDAVYQALAGDFTPMLPKDDPRALSSRQWILGFIHQPTRIGVDLMFMHPRGDVVRLDMGWPDHIGSEVPAYGIEMLRWQDRDWPVPSPPEGFLAAIYGNEWRTPQRHYDTQVSNPSRTPESLSRAVTLGLVRLVEAVRAGQWSKADALSQQILAREDLAEVRRLRARLPRPVMAPA